MLNFCSICTSLILSLSLTSVALASQNMEPVPTVAAKSDRTDDLEEILGRGTIIFGGQYLCPNFASIVSEQLGDVLNDKQQRALVAVCIGDLKIPDFVRSDKWPKALELLKEFQKSGLSQKAGFPQYAARLTEAMMSDNLWSSHLAWLLDPAVLARCAHAKHVNGLIPLLTEKHFYAKRFKEDLQPKKTFRKEYKPKKQHYTKARIHPFIYGWLREADVLKLCHNQRDLKRLLQIVGTDYGMPLFQPQSTLDPEHKARQFNWVNKTYCSEDNILGWLKHSGTLAACQTLDDLQQLFSLFAEMESRPRYLLFQWTEKTGVLRLCEDAAQRIEFLKFFASKNTPEDESAMEAMAFVGAVASAHSTDEVTQVFSMLASYVPEVKKDRDDRSSNGSHLRALASVFALDMCKSVDQVASLLSAVSKGEVIKLLKGPSRGQRYREFGPMLDSIVKVNESGQAVERLGNFYNTYVTKEARYIFADTIEYFRTMDRGLLYDVIHLASLRAEQSKECDCRYEDKYRPSETHIKHDVTKIFEAFFESATEPFYNCTLPGVVDAILAWHNGHALHEDFYGTTYFRPVVDVASPVRQPNPMNEVISEEIKYMSKLSPDQRKFFLSLPYKNFRYRAHCYNCWHDSERIPHKGPEVMRLLKNAFTMPSDLLDKTIYWAKENIFTTDDLRVGHHNDEVEPKLMKLERLFNSWWPGQNEAQFEAQHLTGIVRSVPKDKGEIVPKG